MKRIAAEFLWHCYHTLLEAFFLHILISPGLIFTSHSCKTYCPREVLVAAPGAMRALGRGWPPSPVPAQLQNTYSQPA